MDNIQEKAEHWLNDNVAGWSSTQLQALIMLLTEQDKSTRNACADAVLETTKDMSTSDFKEVVYHKCINAIAI